MGLWMGAQAISACALIGSRVRDHPGGFPTNRSDSAPHSATFRLMSDAGAVNTRARNSMGGEIVRIVESLDTRVRTGRVRAFTNLCLGASISLIVLTGGVPFQDPPPQSRQSDQYTISVSVDMVVLNATVRNRSGVLVSGLGKGSFQVYEDGIPQQIESFSHEDIPVTVGLVVDNSGSMRPKRAEVISAALAFARSSNSRDQMFVVSFNENVSFGLPENTPFTDKEAQLEDALSQIASNGRTALYDAVAAALEHLKKGNRDKKVLIVISDGGDNASKHKLAQIMAAAVQSDAIIYTIGVFDENDPDQNPGVLKQLAQTTGGEAFLPSSAMDVSPICKRIARDIRNQYSISYLPTNGKQDGTYRVIQVNAGTPGRERLLVRTRTGYYAPLKLQPLPAASETP
jgi:Ca-activated chloride channel family protein